MVDALDNDIAVVNKRHKIPAYNWKYFLGEYLNMK
jgi:hypothetical protein